MQNVPIYVENFTGLFQLGASLQAFRAPGPPAAPDQSISEEEKLRHHTGFHLGIHSREWVLRCTAGSGIPWRLSTEKTASLHGRSRGNGVGTIKRWIRAGWADGVWKGGSRERLGEPHAGNSEVVYQQGKMQMWKRRPPLRPQSVSNSPQAFKGHTQEHRRTQRVLRVLGTQARPIHSCPVGGNISVGEATVGDLNREQRQTVPRHSFKI